MGVTQSTEAGGDVHPTQQQDQDSTPSALVVVGPSGVGKGTLINLLKEGSDKFGFSCSHTTRKPREGEQNGIHYHFTDKETFESEIAQGLFLEYAYVHNNIYGTSIKAVKDVANQGKCCILDIDVQGARQVRAAALKAIFVFVAPPSLEELEKRLRGRGTESEEQIATRLQNARGELASLEETDLYDYVLVNNDVKSCLEELKAISARALKGETGFVDLVEVRSGMAAAGSNPTSSSPKEPSSAAASLRGWLANGNEPTTAPATPIGDGTAALLNIGGEHGAANMAAAVFQAGLQRWHGCVAVVTGASSSIGWSLSLALCAAGLRVVAVARSKERLEALQEIAAQHPSIGRSDRLDDFLPVVCDLTKEAEVTALPKIVAQKWPQCTARGIDIIINAACISSKDFENSISNGEHIDTIKNSASSSLIAGNTGEWVEAISAKVLGSALLTREVLLDRKKRLSGKASKNQVEDPFHPGHVVYIVSTKNEDLSKRNGMHGVSAAAVQAMAMELRNELTTESSKATRGTKVSCILTQPKSFNGNALHNGAAEKVDNRLRVEDVVAAVGFCLSAPPQVDVCEIVVKAAAGV